MGCSAAPARSLASSLASKFTHSLAIVPGERGLPRTAATHSLFGTIERNDSNRTAAKSSIALRGEQDDMSLLKGIAERLASHHSAERPHSSSPEPVWPGKLLNQLDQAHGQVIATAYVSLLRWCGYSKALTIGKSVHRLIIMGRLEQQLHLENHLLQMYCDCGALDDAYCVFGDMPERNGFSWNIMCALFVHHGRSKDALRLFEQMLLESVMPDRYSFITIITACSDQASGAKCKRCHALLVSFESDVIVGNALVSMYIRCSHMQDAQRTFDKMLVRDVVSWNAMIAGYARYEHGTEALQLFKQMQRERVVPNKFTFIGILSACAYQTALVEGKQIHDLILGFGLQPDIALSNALINMYDKCGSVEDALITFSNVLEKNTISWTAIIAVYAGRGQGQYAVQLFRQMHQEDVIPNMVTFVTILDACASIGALAVGKHIHAMIMGSRNKLEVVVETSLVNMYGKCGSLEKARNAFDNMSQRNTVSWSTMISACVQHAQTKEALQLFWHMQQEGELPDKATFVSILDACSTQGALREGEQMHACIVGSQFHLDEVLGTALVSMHAKCGNLKDALSVFKKMIRRNSITWNAIIAGHTHHGEGSSALQLFEAMQQEGFMPDEATFVCSFSACANVMDLALGMWMHDFIMSTGSQTDIVLWNAIINMYGKCGSPEDARRVFDNMPKRNLISWNAMIAACAQSGHGKESLFVFNQMEAKGLMPGKATFTVILSACSHAGLIDEAFDCFTSMMQKYGITPIVDHYNCIIDVLGRAGRLDEMEDLLERMPHKPTSVSLMTLLGACRSKGQVKQGEHVAVHMFEIDLGNATPYTLLSNIYAADARLEILQPNEM